MSASLVGSEMCIRDRQTPARCAAADAEAERGVRTPEAENACGLPAPEALATPGTPGAARAPMSGA
eukprot:11259386-Alexandrium_andersonii.AAC.1